ncbi:hypothetical protein EW145_g3537 [Phellinidium pouzarii]|uniref:Cytochrome P450 n=1 Tax=Phellinidium pouzarii TaxID=167371 RepID=A0A4S4L782_9AGAM|nr:hypothetical protein EW145_g3537 [Phellinidium pouzarii]
MLLLILDTAALACALLCLKSWLPLLWSRNKRDRLVYPPGPKGLPLLMSIFSTVPDVGEWEKARRWGQQYGDLVFVTYLGKSYLFVNSYDVAIELFEKRGHNYSSRPHNTLIELEAWDSITTFMRGNELRKSRQFLHRFLGRSAVSDFSTMQTRAIHQLLLRMLREPDEFRNLIRRSAGEAIMMVAYGYQIVSEGADPFVELGDRGGRVLSDAEGFSIVNLMPWLRYLPKWFPGTDFHRLIKEGYEVSQAIMNKPFKMMQQRIHNGSAIPSIMSKLIEANSTEDGSIVDEAIIAKSCGTAYIGGADTTVSILNTFILAMVLHPDAQHRGHEELDRVIGKNNLPTMEDKPNLPYINAICNETLRWQPILPMGVPHCATEDDVYNGYFIPAGTAVIGNIWAMQRDPKVYLEPDKFIPERWLPPDGQSPPLDVHKTAFGFGRRVCSGRFLADNSIFLSIASILAAFRIEKALDVNGVPITPPVEYVESFLRTTAHTRRHPKPFKCRITPRSDKIEAMIHQAVESA